MNRIATIDQRKTKTLLPNGQSNREEIARYVKKALTEVDALPQFKVARKAYWSPIASLTSAKKSARPAITVVDEAGNKIPPSAKKPLRALTGGQGNKTFVTKMRLSALDELDSILLFNRNQECIAFNRQEYLQRLIKGSPLSRSAIWKQQVGGEGIRKIDKNLINKAIKQGHAGEGHKKTQWIPDDRMKGFLKKEASRSKRNPIVKLKHTDIIRLAIAA